jgi:hypothetical protein
MPDQPVLGEIDFRRWQHLQPVPRGAKLSKPKPRPREAVDPVTRRQCLHEAFRWLLSAGYSHREIAERLAEWLE